MGLLDGMLGQLGGGLDLKSLAERVGLSPDEAENAVTALAQAHPGGGDTVETAAQNTGLPAGVLQQIVGHLGGEGGLTQFTSMLGSSGGSPS